MANAELRHSAIDLHNLAVQPHGHYLRCLHNSRQLELAKQYFSAFQYVFIYMALKYYT